MHPAESAGPRLPRRFATVCPSPVLPLYACFLTFAALWLPGCTNRAGSQPGQGSKNVRRTSVLFRNVSDSAGLNYSWPPEPKPLRILEATGGGCAFFDFDGDDWQDILLVTRPYARIWRNTNGRFTETTAETGLDKVTGDWRGCAVGDYDADGRPDLLLTGYLRLALLRNLPGNRFEEVTAAAGLDPANHGKWALSAGFMPLSGSGRLDLVIVNYVQFGPKDEQYCTKDGIRSGCPVNHYKPQFPELWENVGGRFRDASARSGLLAAHGRAMTVAFSDVNDDGRVDLYVGNDGTPSDLLVNRGGMSFTNEGRSSGAAYGPMDHPIAAMGADFGDYDRDGRLDLTVTAFADEAYSLLRNAGDGLFEYKSDDADLSGPTYRTLGFGANWLDFDNDGWEDLAFSNGHVNDVIEKLNPLLTYKQSTMLFHNLPGENGRRFEDLAPLMGADVSAPIVGRGTAAGDFDNDGRMDLLVVDYEGSPLLLRNESVNDNRWLKLSLKGSKPNTFALGARITARSGSQTWVSQVSPTRSFLSSSDTRVHFGAGSVARFDTVEIHWPGGGRQTLSNVDLNRTLRVEQSHAP